MYFLLPTEKLVFPQILGKIEIKTIPALYNKQWSVFASKLKFQ